MYKQVLRHLMTDSSEKTIETAGVPGTAPYLGVDEYRGWQQGIDLQKFCEISNSCSCEVLQAVFIHGKLPILLTAL